MKTNHPHAASTSFVANTLSSEALATAFDLYTIENRGITLLIAMGVAAYSFMYAITVL